MNDTGTYDLVYTYWKCKNHCSFERTLHFWTDNVEVKSSMSGKWESKCGALKMDVCVGWLVNETLYDVIKL